MAAIFDEDGEAAFRALERAAAEAAMRRERVVIAAGGGAFAEPATRAVLAAGAHDGLAPLRAARAAGPHPRRRQSPAGPQSCDNRRTFAPT